MPFRRTEPTWGQCMSCSMATMLACMGCLDVLSEYRYPLINGVIGTILGWATLVVLAGGDAAGR